MQFVVGGGECASLVAGNSVVNSDALAEITTVGLFPSESWFIATPNSRVRLLCPQVFALFCDDRFSYRRRR